jgi:Gene product 88
MKTFAMKWTEGNEKLEKTSGESYKVIGFGIPADYNFILDGQNANTCPQASACRGVCYAKQGRYTMGAVVNARLHNLKRSLTPSFIQDTVHDLKRKGSYNVVRVHDSGDFYNQEYLDKWLDVARLVPDKVFYAYTKSVGLDFSRNPDNFRIVQSVGGMMDERIDYSRPHARIFSSHDDRIAAGYVDGNVNDIPAIEGVIRIGLVYHGVRKLTPAQEKYFSVIG